MSKLIIDHYAMKIEFISRYKQTEKP